MLTQETEIIQIDNEQAYEAKLLASNLSDEQSRKRGMIDYLGILCARKYLYSRKIKTDNKRSVYKIPFLFEEFKISDLYYNNYRIDVITLYKEKTIKIPKIHFDMEILPDFYFVVQIGSKIKESKMIGFIDSKGILNSSHDSKFFYPTLDTIFDLEKFSSLTRRSVPTKTLLGKHIDCLGLFLKFIDNDLSSIYKKQLIQHLMNCDSCRARFIDVMDFEKLAKNINYYPKLIRKYESKTYDEDSILQSKEPLNTELSLEEAIQKSDEIVNNIKQNQKEEELELTNIKPPEENDVDIIYPMETKEKGKLKTVQMFDIVDKPSKTLLTKKVIEGIFNEMPKFELPALKTIMQAKNKRLIIITIAIFLILASFALISFTGTSDAIAENEEMQAYEYNMNDDYPLEYDLPPANGRARLIPKERTLDDFTIAQPVSSNPAYSPTITKVSWEAPQILVKNDNFAKYLKMSGKTIKVNLQNDLLLVNDVPTKKSAQVEVVIDNSGNVLNIETYQTSGSNLVDETVKKAVKDALRHMKPPSVKGDKENVIILNVELN